MGLEFSNLDSFRWTGPLSMASNRVIDTVQEYSLSVIPLFILMGNLVTRSGLSHELYQVSCISGASQGGLSMATIVACVGFSAICGSVWPPRHYHVQGGDAADAQVWLCRLAGGGLHCGRWHTGYFDSASVILVIYSLLTESSIRGLFAAGFIPGFLGILLQPAAVRYVVWRNLKAGLPVKRPRGLNDWSR